MFVCVCVFASLSCILRLKIKRTCCILVTSTHTMSSTHCTASHILHSLLYVPHFLCVLCGVAGLSSLHCVSLQPIRCDYLKVHFIRLISFPPPVLSLTLPSSFFSPSVCVALALQDDGGPDSHGFCFLNNISIGTWAALKRIVE
jgi:hypothetical protein